MKVFIIYFLLVSNIYANEINVGFLMNQKYLCVNLGIVNQDNTLTPIFSKEEALDHPLRIKVDDDNIMQTDGDFKNLKHTKGTTYQNEDTSITLVVTDNKRYMIFKSKKIMNKDMLHGCIETDSWTIAK